MPILQSLGGDRMNRRKRDFFEIRTVRSQVKTEMVRKYFWAWAKIISAQVLKHGGEKIAYVDLFAGRGRYEDGSISTPLRILEATIRDKTIREMLITVFNDADHENVRALQNEIDHLPDINLLKHQPVIKNTEIDDNLTGMLDQTAGIPTLYFLDPWGYKGLSLNLIKAALKNWGSDCIFFFNYNRINAALSNPELAENMDVFFGKQRADRLRLELHDKEPAARQELIIAELKRALKELGGKYSAEYCFKDDSGHKTSHFLIFTSKNALGYQIMKQIMAGESTSNDEGVASFEFNPLDKEDRAEQGRLWASPSAVDELGLSLLREFAGQQISVGEIYRKHNVGKRFVFKNYQDAIKKLDTEGRVETNPPAHRRKRGNSVTLSETVQVTFPKAEVE